jgi:hypothetical protein
MALTRKKVLLAKKETAYGTDPTADASNAIQVTNVEVTPIESDNVEPASFQGFIGNSTRSTLVANKRVSITFDVELAGSGTDGTAPAFGPLLEACGMSEATVAPVADPPATGSVTYTPDPTPTDSVTICSYYDGSLHKITGARGTVTFSMTAGQFPLASFQFIGIFNTVSANSSATTIANQAAALEINDTNVTTATFHGETSQRIESFDFALNNNLIYKETASNQEAIIVDRTPGGTAVIEAPSLGSVNYFTKVIGTTTASSSIVIGASAGNITTLTIPQTDITGVTYGDTNGVISLSMPYAARPTGAGNDEFSLAFT